MTDEEVKHISERFKQEKAEPLESLKERATASCNGIDPDTSTSDASQPCYQDDLLDTDCSTTI